MTAPIPGIVLDNGAPWYKNWYKGFARQLRIGWQPSAQRSPSFEDLGKAGRYCLRAGYSLAYSREGTQDWVAPPIPETWAAIASRSRPEARSRRAVRRRFAPVRQNLNIQSLVGANTRHRLADSFPDQYAASNAVNAADPNLHMPYVQSWSLGVQRSLTRDMAVEVRYVGNHGVALWERENLNEVNIFENGFLNEFKLAQQNLNICQQNSAACIASQANSGVATGSQTASNFAIGGCPANRHCPSSRHPSQARIPRARGLHRNPTAISAARLF